MNEFELRTRFVADIESYAGCAEGSVQHREILSYYNSIDPLPRKYKMTVNDPWCATTISAIAQKQGLTDIIFPECSCGRMIDLYKAAGRWMEADDYVPQVGDIVMYTWSDNGEGDCTGAPDHVGAVKYVENGVIHVVEGNFKDTVAVRRIRVNGRYIRGYCLPDYATKATSTMKTYEEVAMEVYLGEGGWGNNPERRKRLEAAGYDYDAVQERVNAIWRDHQLDVLAEQVMDGDWGVNPDRKKRLEAAGYDYDAVQKRVMRNYYGG